MLDNLWVGTTLYSPDDGAGGSAKNDESGDKGKGGESDSKGSENAESLDYQTWHDGLPKEQQSLIAANEAGLKTALGSERDARVDAEKELRKAAKGLEEGSEAQKQLEESADALADTNAKADFYEDAHAAGVTNLKLAHHIAVTDGLINKRGGVDFAKMKEDYPELFAKKRSPQGDIGAGTGGEASGRTTDMNAAIRTAAGKN